MIIKRHLNIKDEKKTLNNVLKLNSDFKKFKDILKKYNLTYSFDFDKIMREYTDINIKSIFNENIVGIVKIGLEQSLNKEKYIEDYIIQNKLNHNDIIELYYNNLEQSLEDLGLYFSDIVEDMTLDIDYYSIDDTPYTDFLENEIDIFLEKYEHYMGQTQTAFLKDLFRRNMEQNMRYDIINKSKGPLFDDWCERKRSEGQIDFYRIVKNEQYNIL